MLDTHAPATVAALQQGGGNRLPAEIAKAIGEVMIQVLSLPSAEGNDDFLAAVGPLCSRAGLIVLQDEESADLIDRSGKGWLRVTYAFSLAHTSGAVSERPIRRTVLQPVTGPRTTGSSQSYALKQFMRSLFQIAMGDRDDAEYRPKVDRPAADQQARSRPRDCPERPATGTPPKAPGGVQRAPGAPGKRPGYVRIEQGRDGLMVGRWVAGARELLADKPEAWRREWLERHAVELDEVRKARREWADRLESLAVAPDLTPMPGAAE
jgi:hypothetical protein